MKENERCVWKTWEYTSTGSFGVPDVAAENRRGDSV